MRFAHVDLIMVPDWWIPTCANLEAVSSQRFKAPRGGGKQQKSFVGLDKLGKDAMDMQEAGERLKDIMFYSWLNNQNSS